MDYLQAYLGVGILVLIAIGIDSIARKPRRASELARLAEELRRGRQSRLEKIREHAVLPAVAGLAIIVAWPLAAVFAIHLYRQRQNAPDRTEAEQFRAFSVEWE